MSRLCHAVWCQNPSLMEEVSLIYCSLCGRNKGFNSLRLRSTGGWKPLRDPQEIIFDSIMNMRYVIIDKR